MIKKIVFGLALAVLNPLSSQATMINGETLVGLMKAYQAASGNQPNAVDQMRGSMYMGYISGIVDSFTGKVFCVPSGITAGTMASITSDYVANNPDVIVKNGSDIVIQAMRQKYPCH